MMSSLAFWWRGEERARGRGRGSKFTYARVLNTELQEAMG